MSAIGSLAAGQLRGGHDPDSVIRGTRAASTIQTLVDLDLMAVPEHVDSARERHGMVGSCHTTAFRAAKLQVHNRPNSS